MKKFSALMNHGLKKTSGFNAVIWAEGTRMQEALKELTEVMRDP